MRVRIQTHYATVASTLALVEALAGSSYAAAQITGADIKNGTITGADIKGGSLPARDLTPDAVTSVRGPAWEISRNDVTITTGSGWVPIVSQTVPINGNYTVMVTAQVAHGGSANIGTGCLLNTPQNNEYVQIYLPRMQATDVLTMQSTMKGGGTVTLSCAPHPNITYTRTTLIVTEVGRLTQVP